MFYGKRGAKFRKKEGQRIGNQIDAATILAGANFVNVRSFFESFRAAVLDVRPVDMIFVKENIIHVPLIDHFSTPVASVEVAFLGFAQLVKVSGIQGLIALR